MRQSNSVGLRVFRSTDVFQNDIAFCGAADLELAVK